MISIKLNKEIYSKSAIGKGIKAYKNIGKFSVREKGKYFQISADISNSNFDEEQVEGEFCNFILAGSIKK